MFNTKFSLLGEWEAYPSAAFNLIAACCFFAILLPDFIEVIKTKKNYSTPMRFFLCLSIASFILLVHACLGVYGVSQGGKGGKGDAKTIAKYVMLGCFLVVNLFATIANLYQVKVKLEISKKAKANNMSEADYWENHVRPSLVLK